MTVALIYAHSLANIVLTVTDQNLVEYTQGGGGGPPPPGAALLAQPPQPPPPLIFPFRQALYLDETGIVRAKSVFAAVAPNTHTASILKKSLTVRSTGENFDGIYVAGGTYTLKNPKIEFTGNGCSDFIGYGAGIVGTGEDTTLVVDGATIINRGVARAAVVADKGANVIVKNSHIETYNGVLPDDYVPTIDMGQMRSVPWMLSLSGNVRATNLLGTNTKAAYINSYIASEGWGVLSTDGCTKPTLTAINSTIAILGEDGYGSYGIGDATEYFLGCTFDVGTYATISRGSNLGYGDSDPAVVADTNARLGLGLTAKELSLLKEKPTLVNSDRFGIMWHGGGTLNVWGGTIFNTDETTFLDKGQAININVDGSQGARLNPGNGIIMQVMDDDPGPVPPAMTNTGVYHEPVGPAAPDPTHSRYFAYYTDAIAAFSHINLVCDFYNSTRGGIVQGPFGPPSSVSKNLCLRFYDSTVTGVVSSSTAVHPISTITAADYKYLGEVTNTPSPAVNNGAIVELYTGSEWVVTGTCYLTSLLVSGDSSVTAPAGHSLHVTLDGVPTEIVPGIGRVGNFLLTID